MHKEHYFKYLELENNISQFFLFSDFFFRQCHKPVVSDPSLGELNNISSVACIH